MLDSISEEALIRRDGHVITKINWQALLRARGASYQLMKANHAVPTLARQGVNHVLDALRHERTSHQVLATGSYAARAFAPLSVGGPLMLYVPPGLRVTDEVADQLGLLRVDRESADVVLLQPMSVGAMERPHPAPVDGVAIVGLSQLVLDCLSGPGRMPAEGEALLEWMSDHEADWRMPSPLDAARPAGGADVAYS